MSLASFAQTRYSSFGIVDNPPYGMVAQLWNASTNVVYFDGLTVSAVPILPLPHGSNGIYPVSFLEFAFELANKEESQCTSVTSFVMGGSTAIQAPSTIRVSKQPCTPNGRPYGQPNGDGTFNYTIQNFVIIDTCIAMYCRIELSASPIPVQPNTGITIYTAAYDGVNGFSWTGETWFNFRWHQ